MRVQALLCSGSSDCCIAELCLETLSLRLQGLFLLSSCTLILCGLFHRGLYRYDSHTGWISLVFQYQNISSVYLLAQPVLCSKKLIQLYHVSASLVLVEHIKLFLTFSVLVDCTKLGRYTQHREISTPGNEVGKQQLWVLSYFELPLHGNKAKSTTVLGIPILILNNHCPHQQKS